MGEFLRDQAAPAGAAHVGPGCGMTGPTTVVSPLDHAATLRRLDAILAEHGLTVFALIDHAANAVAVGLEMPPATVVIFGSARAGTPVMRAAPQLALDLPLRILVREDDAGRVLVEYHHPEQLVAGYDLPPNLRAGLAGIVAVVASLTTTEGHDPIGSTAH